MGAYRKLGIVSQSVDKPLEIENAIRNIDGMSPAKKIPASDAVIAIATVRMELRDTDPRYVGGGRNAPPEDCGGLPGFYDMLDAITDPSHPNHADAKEWADDYDPDVIDEPEIKDALGRMNPGAKAWPARKSGAGPSE